MPLYELTNKKSGAQAIVTEQEWELIKSKGMASKYTFKMQSSPVARPPFVPQEVKDMRAKKSEDKTDQSEDNKQST